MSWLFSQALVEEYSAGTCSDGEPCAPSSGNPTQLAYCSPDKTTAFSRLSRFGMTFRPLTEDRGEALLTSFLGGFPAKTSASQDAGTASMESAAECGNTWRGWLAKYDPATSSWRTAQCSLLEDSTESLVTLPRSGMTRDGLLWELPTLERRTSAIASGLWPAPLASDAESAGGIGCWQRGKRGLALNTAVRLEFPTPGYNDFKSGKGYNHGDKKQTPQLRHISGGMLNPTWVEWLMGWPLGWTDLKPLETGKSLCAPQPHGDCLQEG